MRGQLVILPIWPRLDSSQLGSSGFCSADWLTGGYLVREGISQVCELGPRVSHHAAGWPGLVLSHHSQGAAARSLETEVQNSHNVASIIFCRPEQVTAWTRPLWGWSCSAGWGRGQAREASSAGSVSQITTLLLFCWALEALQCCLSRGAEELRPGRGE